MEERKLTPAEDTLKRLSPPALVCCRYCDWQRPPFYRSGKRVRSGMATLKEHVKVEHKAEWGEDQRRHTTVRYEPRHGQPE